MSQSHTRLPAGRLIKAEFEFRLPVDATHVQIEEWVRFEALKVGTLAATNPLVRHELEGFTGTVLLTDTAMQGRVEEFDHKPAEGGGTEYKVRYVRPPT
ncbi:hypothetical protein [Azospirillum sp. Marseille-Q6669]